MNMSGPTRSAAASVPSLMQQQTNQLSFSANTAATEVGTPIAPTNGRHRLVIRLAELRRPAPTARRMTHRGLGVELAHQLGARDAGDFARSRNVHVPEHSIRRNADCRQELVDRLALSAQVEPRAALRIWILRSKTSTDSAAARESRPRISPRTCRVPPSGNEITARRCRSTKLIAGAEGHNEAHPIAVVQEEDVLRVFADECRLLRRQRRARGQPPR